MLQYVEIVNCCIDIPWLNIKRSAVSSGPIHEPRRSQRTIMVVSQILKASGLKGNLYLGFAKVPWDG